MEVILDELQKNNVDIDMRTLSYHLNYLMSRHKRIYTHVVRCVNGHELSYVFSKMNANNFDDTMLGSKLVFSPIQ